jgi:hypothetical protein
MNISRVFWNRAFLAGLLAVLLFLSPGGGFTKALADEDDEQPLIEMNVTPNPVRPGATFNAHLMTMGGKITSCLIHFDDQAKSCLGREGQPMETNFITASHEGTFTLTLSVIGRGGSLTRTQPVKVTPDAVPEPSSPVYGTWTSLYAPLFRTPSDLEVLRQYRDEFLTRTGRGKLYTDLLYENSEAALRVLMDNPELIERAGILLQANQDGILQVLNGKEAVVSQPDDIAAFLDDFAARSPATLRVLAKMVKREMLQKFREYKPFIGFRRE